MPIFYNKERGGWEAQNLTDDEKEALLQIAQDFLVDAMGNELAHNLMQVAMARGAIEPKLDLEAIDVEDMPSA